MKVADWKSRTRIYRLAMWAKMPGDDFDKPWAGWMLGHDWAMFLFEQWIEQPLCALACWRDGHRIKGDLCGLPEHRFCFVCDKNIKDL